MNSRIPIHQTLLRCHPLRCKLRTQHRDRSPNHPCQSVFWTSYIFASRFSLQFLKLQVATRLGEHFRQNETAEIFEASRISPFLGTLVLAVYHLEIRPEST